MNFDVHAEIGGFGTAQSSKLYWLNIDVRLRDIFFRQRVQRGAIVPGQSLSLEYCVLQGVGEVANALTVGQNGVDFDRFLVDISGLASKDDGERSLGSLEVRQRAGMVWNKTNERHPRLDIFLPNRVSRHLIELYTTKRMNRIELAMQIAVIRSMIDVKDDLPERFPFLGEEEHLFFPRVRCELLSVYASIAKT